MGIAERRNREKIRRRNDILNAAETVFFEKGLSASTMDDVAAGAELSKGTLYLYFESKEQLYLGIIIRALELLNYMFREALSKGDTGLEKLREIGRAYHQYYHDYPNYFNALLYFEGMSIANPETDPIAGQCLMQGQENMEIMLEAIDQGKKDGSIKSGLDSKHLALILWGSSTGFYQIMHKKTDMINDIYKVNPETMIEEYFNFIIRAMG